MTNIWVQNIPEEWNDEECDNWISQKHASLMREIITKISVERPAEWIREKLDDPSYTERWEAICRLCERSY
jgi:hypothetical protein